jgi:hypothetical protein
MSEINEAEAIELTESAPAIQPAAPTTEFDHEYLAEARRALEAGQPSEMVGRHYGLSKAELAAISNPAPSRQTINQQLAAMDKLRRSDPKAYWSDVNQSKHLALIEAQLKQKAERAAPAPETSDRLAKIDEELHQIDAKRRENGPAYRRDTALQERELALLREKEKLINGIGDGLDPELIAEWEKTGGVERNLSLARAAAQKALDELDEGEKGELAASFDGLPGKAQTEIYKYLAVEPGNWRPARDEELTVFASTDDGKALIEEWGANASKRLGQLRGRAAMMLGGMSAADRARTERWVNGLSSSQFRAVVRALLG